MEGNKEEARRAMNIAERKLKDKDYLGAKKFINKAQNLYPILDGLKQALMMINVYISASNRGGEADWYGILGVDPLADVETVKRQYKKLALLLHPDKNKFDGAEEAFKLILNACSLLSDKVERSAYDQKRKSKQVNREPVPKPDQQPPSSSSSSSQTSTKPDQQPPPPSSSYSSTTSASYYSVWEDAEEVKRKNWNTWLEESRKRKNKNQVDRLSKKPMRTKTPMPTC